MGMFKSASGGGFLAGVSGGINSIKFGTKLWPAKVKGKDGATKTTNAYTTLSAEVLITPDGAEKPVQQFIPAGFFYPENQSISDDGYTLQSDGDGAIIKEDTDFARFVTSAVVAGMDLNEDNTQGGRNFEVMHGYRVTFAKIKDEAAQLAVGTKRLGDKAKTATAAEILAAGKRADKNDKNKSYNLDYLAISAVLGAPIASKGGPRKATNGSGKALPPAAAVDVDTAGAAKILIGLLAAADDNTLKVGVVKSLVTLYAVENSMDKPEREALAKLIGSAEFIGTQQGWTLDTKAKTISLA